MFAALGFVGAAGVIFVVLTVTNFLCAAAALDD
jgi:hypothetical protein